MKKQGLNWDTFRQNNFISKSKVEQICSDIEINMDILDHTQL